MSHLALVRSFLHMFKAQKVNVNWQVEIEARNFPRNADADVDCLVRATRPIISGLRQIFWQESKDTVKILCL